MEYQPVVMIAPGLPPQDRLHLLPLFTGDVTLFAKYQQHGNVLLGVVSVTKKKHILLKEGVNSVMDGINTAVSGYPWSLESYYVMSYSVTSKFLAHVYRVIFSRCNENIVDFHHETMLLSLLDFCVSNN